MELNTVEDALAALLSKNPDEPREEPEIATAIGAQLSIMELSSMPISLRRRIRDIVSRVKPDRICEVGAGIGHLSAWLLDLWSRTEPPSHHHLVESGGKFGVILTRLVRRYDAESWAHVTVGDFQTLCADQMTWNAAHSTLDLAARPRPPLFSPFEMIIVDVGWKGQVENIRSAMSTLAPGGLILTMEPEVPVDDVGEISEEGPINPEQARVVAFNHWTRFISEISDTHTIGFVPMHGGTLVGIIQA
ncbi:MAG: hypothetical protein QGF94_01350 [Candidatus Thalassarchaeaceae archaeon]|nr:hypothetical protein [Candidatus Thalassarchaeaceae archaeon]